MPYLTGVNPRDTHIPDYPAAGGSGRENWNGEIAEGELKGLLDLAMDEAYDYFMEGMDERLIIGAGKNNSKLKVIIKRVEAHGEVDYCIETGAEQNALKSFLLGMTVEEGKYSGFGILCLINGYSGIMKLIEWSGWEESLIAKGSLDEESYYYGKYINDIINESLAELKKETAKKLALAGLLGGAGWMIGGSQAASAASGGQVIVSIPGVGEMVLVLEGATILAAVDGKLTESKAGNNAKENLEKSQQAGNKAEGEFSPNIKGGDKTPNGKAFTDHAAEQASKRGYSPKDIDNIINNWTTKYYQPGGRSVYIKKNNYGYDVVFIDENEKGIISVIGGNGKNGVKNTLPNMKIVEQMLNNNGSFSTLPFSY